MALPDFIEIPWNGSEEGPGSYEIKCVRVRLKGAHSRIEIDPTTIKIEGEPGKIVSVSNRRADGMNAIFDAGVDTNSAIYSSDGFLKYCREPFQITVKAEPKQQREGAKPITLRGEGWLRFGVGLRFHWRISENGFPDNYLTDEIYARTKERFEFPPDGVGSFHLKLSVDEWHPGKSAWVGPNFDFHDYTHWLAPNDPKIDFGVIEPRPRPQEDSSRRADTDWYSARYLPDETPGPHAVTELPYDFDLRARVWPHRSVLQRLPQQPKTAPPDQEFLDEVDVPIRLIHGDFEIRVSKLCFKTAKVPLTDKTVLRAIGNEEGASLTLLVRPEYVSPLQYVNLRSYDVIDGGAEVLYPEVEVYRRGAPLLALRRKSESPQTHDPGKARGRIVLKYDEQGRAVIVFGQGQAEVKLPEDPVIDPDDPLRKRVEHLEESAHELRKVKDVQIDVNVGKQIDRYYKKLFMDFLKLDLEELEKDNGEEKRLRSCSQLANLCWFCRRFAEYLRLFKALRKEAAVHAVNCIISFAIDGLLYIYGAASRGLNYIDVAAKEGAEEAMKAATRIGVLEKYLPQVKKKLDDVLELLEPLAKKVGDAWKTIREMTKKIVDLDKMIDDLAEEILQKEGVDLAGLKAAKETLDGIVDEKKLAQEGAEKALKEVEAEEIALRREANKATLAGDDFYENARKLEVEEAVPMRADATEAAAEATRLDGVHQAARGEVTQQETRIGTQQGVVAEAEEAAGAAAGRVTSAQKDYVAAADKATTKMGDYIKAKNTASDESLRAMRLEGDVGKLDHQIELQQLALEGSQDEAERAAIRETMTQLRAERITAKETAETARANATRLANEATNIKQVADELTDEAGRLKGVYDEALTTRKQLREAADGEAKTLSEMRARLTEMENQAKTAGEEAAEAGRKASQLETEATELESQVAGIRQQGDQKHQEAGEILDRVNGECREKISNAEGEVGRAGSAVETAVADAERKQGEIDKLQGQLNVMKDDRQSLVNEREGFRRQRDQAKEVVKENNPELKRLQKEERALRETHTRGKEELRELKQRYGGDSTFWSRTKDDVSRSIQDIRDKLFQDVDEAKGFFGKLGAYGKVIARMLTWILGLPGALFKYVLNKLYEFFMWLVSPILKFLKAMFGWLMRLLGTAKPVVQDFATEYMKQGIVKVESVTVEGNSSMTDEWISSEVRHSPVWGQTDLGALKARVKSNAHEIDDRHSKSLSDAFHRNVIASITAAVDCAEQHEYKSAADSAKSFSNCSGVVDEFASIRHAEQRAVESSGWDTIGLVKNLCSGEPTLRDGITLLHWVQMVWTLWWRIGALMIAISASALTGPAAIATLAAAMTLLIKADRVDVGIGGFRMFLAIYSDLVPKDKLLVLIHTAPWMAYEFCYEEGGRTSDAFQPWIDKAREGELLQTIKRNTWDVLGEFISWAMGAARSLI